ncbi:hypothetical protein [Rhodoferax sp. BAB1]|uniref:DUF4760 domain-containing protein n=1 Tax=Rhodoferax sp. BAB1 TaxID=2741720 RepID=UPI0015755018|nr:hypothetical protein [Rhodoferax sp. BAB1]QKO22696.1 hypothetical protein HTY51_12820 [Rhodoferax sp. BAB1]
MTLYEKTTLALQLVVAVGVFATLGVYYHQLKVMAKQLSAMQDSSRVTSALAIVAFLQSDDVRAARQCVREVLSKKELAEWSSDERRAASTVTANYDVAAALLKSGLAPAELVTVNWGPSIKHCYEVLKPFVEEHRSKPGADPMYWSNFDWLYSQAGGGAART